MPSFKTLFAVISSYFRILKERRVILFPEKDTPVLLNFMDGKYVPYVKGLFWFKTAENTHVQFTNWKFVITADKLRPKNSLPIVYVIFPVINKYKTCISDKSKFRNRKDWKFISHEYFHWIVAKDKKVTPLPFVMHHTNYGLTRSLEREKKRDIRIFFSGNSNQESYSNEVFSNVFGILNRVEIIETLKKYAHDKGGSVSFDIHENSDIQILDWQWSASISSKLDNRIENKEWLQYLARADFFICCPGVNMPFCHNAIEAMKMGCIPVLQYNNLFAPHLKHRENCIVFTGKEDLINKIEEILKMTTPEIELMQYHVNSYFKTYLQPNAIHNLFENELNSEFVFPVNTHSINSYVQEFGNRSISSFTIDS